MSSSNRDDEDLLEKIRALPPERFAEVADFVEFLPLKEEDQHLRRAAMRASEPAPREALG